jgi:hypothetical protein
MKNGIIFRAMLLSVFAILPQLSNTVVKAKIEIEEIEGSIKVMELKIYQKLYKVYPINYR